MSERKVRTASYMEERAQGACVGDFVLLKKFLAEKNKPIWIPLQLLDALLRGYGQVAFANNPLSGLLIVIALGATAPKILAFSAATGFLGLLLSMLMKDSQHVIENGLTVFNPLLIGALSCGLVPNFYGEFDAFSYLLILIGTIISVYLTRSLGTDKFPCTVWPFNLVELILLFVFTTQNSFVESLQIESIVSICNLSYSPRHSDQDSSKVIHILRGFAEGKSKPKPPHIASCIAEISLWRMRNYVQTRDATCTLYSRCFEDNATSDARTDDASFIAENVTDVNVDWGMVFRGMVVSSSQLFSVDNVVAGAVIYLAVLIYSPATAGFSFAGVFIGLELGAPHNEVFTGLWGFNCFLTGAALGGNLFVINIQTAVATLVAIVYTVVLQYVLRIIFGKIGLPFLTLPFVISTSLFLKLRSASSSAAFPKPLQSSYPEKQRHDYLINRKRILQENVDGDDGGGSGSGSSGGRCGVKCRGGREGRQAVVGRGACIRGGEELNASLPERLPAQRASLSATRRRVSTKKWLEPARVDSTYQRVSVVELVPWWFRVVASLGPCLRTNRRTKGIRRRTRCLGRVRLLEGGMAASPVERRNEVVSCYGRDQEGSREVGWAKTSLHTVVC
uniref:Urea transporter n=1 Tax=Vespula pensylvanica TaxID=30213 RepID=A0A834KV21_VESPE|nr:hypothetical protein H0235_013323 [Vespula pensylvanica]